MRVGVCAVFCVFIIVFFVFSIFFLLLQCTFNDLDEQRVHKNTLSTSCAHDICGWSSSCFVGWLSLLGAAAVFSLSKDKHDRSMMMMWGGYDLFGHTGCAIGERYLVILLQSADGQHHMLGTFLDRNFLGASAAWLLDSIPCGALLQSRECPTGDPT